MTLDSILKAGTALATGALLTLSGCASDEAGLDMDAIAIADGKADTAGEITVQGNSIYLQGSRAEDLWDVMEDAGGFDAIPHNGLDYLVGAAMLCASNGQAAACQIVSGDIGNDLEGYAATIHGPRFSSSASELFGALARADGKHPANVDFAESGLIHCGKNSQDVWCGFTSDEPESNTRTLELDVSELPELGSDFVYEGWLITPNGPITSGRFDHDGGVHSFDIDLAVANATTSFVLTIEPRVGDDPAPAPVHIVAGAFQNGDAALSSADAGAVGSDFADAEGAFILETPTTSVMNDYAQGIWFVNPAAGAPSLDLPTLNSGWAYEGWVVTADGPISTGRFTSTSGIDSDGAGPTAGNGDAPPFPGQDFIKPPIDLIGATVVISVEPEPDDSPAPFALKPLVGPMAQDLGAGTLQKINPNAAELSGVASWR